MRDLWAVCVCVWGIREEVGNSLSQVLQLSYVGVSRIFKGSESILYVNCILSRWRLKSSMKGNARKYPYSITVEIAKYPEAQELSTWYTHAKNTGPGLHLSSPDTIPSRSAVLANGSTCCRTKEVADSVSNMCSPFVLPDGYHLLSKSQI